VKQFLRHEAKQLEHDRCSIKIAATKGKIELPNDVIDQILLPMISQTLVLPDDIKHLLEEWQTGRVGDIQRGAGDKSWKDPKIESGRTIRLLHKFILQFGIASDFDFDYVSTRTTDEEFHALEYP